MDTICPSCGSEMEGYETHPYIFDKETKGLKVDGEGMLIVDNTLPKIIIPKCIECERIYV